MKRKIKITLEKMIKKNLEDIDVTQKIMEDLFFRENLQKILKITIMKKL